MKNKSITFVIIALFLLLGVSTNSILAKINQSNNTITETGFNTVFVHPSDGQQVFYNINVTQNLISTSIDVTFLFQGWGAQNINRDQNQLKLTIITIDPSGNVTDSILVSFSTNSKLVTLNPTVEGIYTYKLFFNYTGSIFLTNSQSSEIGTTLKVSINNFSGTSWVYTMDETAGNVNSSKYVNMRDTGSTVLYWLYFDKGSTYVLGLQSFSPSNVLNKFVFTNKINKSNSFTLQVPKQFQNIETFQFKINLNQTGWWKLEYNEISSNMNMFYILYIRDSSYYHIPFYLPFSDQSSPKFISSSSSNLNNSKITLTKSLEFPVMNMGILIAVGLLMVVKKKRT